MVGYPSRQRTPTSGSALDSCNAAKRPPSIHSARLFMFSSKALTVSWLLIGLIGRVAPAAPGAPRPLRARTRLEDEQCRKERSAAKLEHLPQPPRPAANRASPAASREQRRRLRRRLRRQLRRAHPQRSPPQRRSHSSRILSLSSRSTARWTSAS